MRELLILGVLIVFISLLPPTYPSWERGIVVNASLAELGYSIEISDKLLEGIFFTNLSGSMRNVQYPLLSGSTKNNATWNYNSSDINKKTGYWISVSGNIRIDICHGTSTNLCSTPNCTGEGNIEINISNMVWSSSLTSDKDIPSPLDTKPMTIGYDNSNKVAVGVMGGDVVYLRYWLNIPPGTPGANYSTIYKIQAVPSGGKCG